MDTNITVTNIWTEELDEIAHQEHGIIILKKYGRHNVDQMSANWVPGDRRGELDALRDRLRKCLEK